jgi:hypothetical protein
MLNKAKILKGYTLDSLNGEIGKVTDFYFDDKHWAVRYLVADTGGWLANRQVLISPYALGGVDKVEESLIVNLTKKQIEDSPSLDTDKPVSRQFEETYYGYYEWPVYWSGPYAWGEYPTLERDRENWREAVRRTENAWDPHLRSAHAVSGYHIQANDGEIGHVEDFLIDDDSWAIRYLIIDPKNWWPGKKILVSPRWSTNVSWSQSKVFFNLSREEIRKAPEYTDDSLVNRDYESGLFRHYDRAGYWDEEPLAEAVFAGSKNPARSPKPSARLKRGEHGQ